MLPSAAPQAPAPAPPAATLTGGASNLTLPQNIGRAMTLQDVQLLQNRRSELSRQLSSASDRRTQVVRDIGRDAIGRDGLEARLKVLDERIVQLEKDIAQNGQLLASAPANLVEETSPPPSFPSPPRGITGATAVSIAFTFAVLFPLTVTFCLRMLHRLRAPAVAPLPPEATLRLERIENAVDSIAVEVERISEGQRFVTKLMSEPRQLGAGAAERIVVLQGERVPLERNDSA